jgi:hypothetical protein
MTDDVALPTCIRTISIKIPFRVFVRPCGFALMTEEERKRCQVCDVVNRMQRHALLCKHHKCEASPAIDTNSKLNKGDGTKLHTA